MTNRVDPTSKSIDSPSTSTLSASVQTYSNDPLLMIQLHAMSYSTCPLNLTKKCQAWLNITRTVPNEHLAQDTRLNIYVQS